MTTHSVRMHAVGVLAKSDVPGLQPDADTFSSLRVCQSTSSLNPRIGP